MSALTPSQSNVADISAFTLVHWLSEIKLNVTCHPAEVTFPAPLLGRIAVRIAFTRPVVAVIARSVFCPSVCSLVVSVGCAKTDEPIEVPSGLRILVGIRDSNK